MVDVAISSQLQQWMFDKTIRPQRSNSAATSPDLCGSEALRISPTAVETPQDLETTEAIFQDRYLSSEEDLSPMESDSGEGIIFEGGGDDYLSTKRISFSGPELSKACDLAVVVSYVSAGRPKIVNLPLAIRERPSRSSSLVNLSESAKPLLPQPSRLSLSTSSSGPSSASGSRRPSTANNLFSQEPSTLRISTSSAPSPSTDTPSQRSTSSPSATSDFKRPCTAKATSSLYSKSPRTSEYPTSANSPSSLFPLLTPATPSTPQTPSFLSSDPFANDSMSTASPIIKNAPHKRLRSISRTLSLAKIAVIPTYKKVETKKDTTRGGWGSPVSPYAPQTPIPAIVLPSPALSRGKRASQMMPRGADEREPPFELLSVPAELSDPIQRPRMVPRGADERASPIELPPFPTNNVPNIKTRRLRKRRSLIDFERLSNLK